MLEITPHISIPDAEFEWSFARSGGPGGQNVNKVASKAVLRWDFEHSPSGPDGVKARFRERFPSRLTTEGEVVVASELTRDQGRNREDCLEKVADLLRALAPPPKTAWKSGPTGCGPSPGRRRSAGRPSRRRAPSGGGWRRSGGSRSGRPA